jgi:UDP-glucose 4-epimerase
MFGKDYPKEYISARSGEYPFTLADFTKAKVELGWIPTLDIKDYIKDIVKKNNE